MRIRRAAWRRAAALCIGVLLATGIFSPAAAGIPMTPYGSPIPIPQPVSYDGTDRYAVSVSIAAEVSKSAGVGVVYLVSGTAYADAVAAGPAAARDEATILYTDKDSLPVNVANELVLLRPTRLVLVGGAGVISDSVITRATSLLGPGLRVERIDAGSSWDIAAALSERDFKPGVDTVVVASSGNFFNGLVAGPVAADLAAPLLLVAAGSLPSVTAAELKRLTPRRVVLIGNSDDISADVEARIKAIVPNVERVSGSDRYATAAAVRSRFFATPTGVVATSGVTELGGLAAVPVAAADRAPILLTQDGDQLPTATRDSLVESMPRRIFIAGSIGDIIAAEVIGYSDGSITMPTETATYPAWDSGYHDPAEMLTVLKATEIAYPNLVTILSIGKSYEGRDIWMAKVSADVAIDKGKPEILVNALQHASEHLGVEQALYLLRTLTSGYATDPYVHRLVDSRVTWIIFAVNPDGWVYDLQGDPYNLWRKNRQPNANNTNIGTNLNRNYGYKWGSGAGGNDLPWSGDYWGAAPFSAPETQAVRDFVASRVIDGVQRIRTHVDIHTHGEFILFPFAYTYANTAAGMSSDDHSVFTRMSATMASMNGYAWEQSSVLYPTDGDIIDWMYGTYGIFSFTFELYPTAAQAGRGIVYVSDSVIARQTARNRGALLYLIDAAGCPYAAIGKAAQYCPGAAAG
ncbi:MAG TPA: M14 family zinc carboxypeptidase [Candidatus Limnocylindrales bacterium]